MEDNVFISITKESYQSGLLGDISDSDVLGTLIQTKTIFIKDVISFE